MFWCYDPDTQSQDRNHRIGQTAPVTDMRLLAADTITEVIVIALDRKSAQARGLLADEEEDAMVSRLSQAEMCKLLAYNRLPESEVANRSTMAASQHLLKIIPRR